MNEDDKDNVNNITLLHLREITNDSLPLAKDSVVQMMKHVGY